MRTHALNAGVEIPCLGLGARQIVGEEAAAAASEAVRAGHRHVDTRIAQPPHFIHTLAQGRRV